MSYLSGIGRNRLPLEFLHLRFIFWLDILA